NEGLVGAGTTVTADGVVLGATMKSVDGNQSHDYAALSTSGASAGDIGVAGPFALSVVHSNTQAVFGRSQGSGGATSLTLTGGTSRWAGAETSNRPVRARAAGAGGGSSTGVGVSFAMALAFNPAGAGIDDGVTVNGTTGGLYASVTSNHTVNTTATGGAKGGT